MSPIRFFVMGCGLLCMLLQCSHKEILRGGCLVIGSATDALSLDPGDQWDLYSSQVVVNIFETLVRYKEGSFDIEPCLAESWKVSDDGLVWQFQLRRNVLFHDGTRFNADAVLFSFQRQMDSSFPFRFGDFEAWDPLFGMIKTIRALSEYDVEISLNEPYAPFLSNLTLDQAGIVSPTAVKKWQESFFENPIGTGPFVFDKWFHEDRIIITANENYWDKRPFLDTVIFRTIEDNTLRMAELKRGNLHFVRESESDNFSIITGLSSLKIIQTPVMDITYLAMNTQRHPFDDVRVRLALASGFQKERLIRYVYQDRVTVATTPLPKEMWGFNDTLHDYAYDPSKTADLLREAGYPRGLDIHVLIPQGNLEQLKFMQLVRENLLPMGINLLIEIMDWKQLIETAQNGEHEALVATWEGDTGDPDNFLYVLLDRDNARLGGENLAFYTNDSLHAILTQARKTEFLPVREKLYKQAQEIIHCDVPWIPLWHSKSVWILNEKIRNCVPGPSSQVRFQHVYFKK